MDRRSFLVGMGALVTLPAVARAQQAGKVWRIGYLSATTAGADKTWVSAFQQGLRELGYVEGDNVVIEQRHAAGQLERLSELAVGLARLKVDVFVVYAGPPGIHAAKKASSTTPVVFTVSSDPVGLGLVASLARPGGSVTGLSDFHAGLGPKRLELLKDLLPSASRVAVLLNPANPVAVLWLKQIRAAAPGLGVTLLSLEIKRTGA